MTPLSTLTRSKPFYVVAGAGDLAVKTVRDLPARLSQAKLVAVKLDKDELTKAVSTLQSEAVAQASALPAKAQTAAVTAAVEVADKADAVYTELLGRGRRVVGRIRRQQATQDLKKDAATTVRRTRAAATTAKAGASDTTRAAKGTATTARKSAKKATGSTRTATKRTTTTARKRAAATSRAASSAATAATKTASSAGQAVSDGASKVGN